MKFIATILVVVSASFVFGCEVCGCSAAGNSIGTIGASKNHLIGMTFQGRYFKSAHPALFSNELERSAERFYTANLAGKFQAHRRVQIVGALPFHYNQQTKEGVTTFKQGIGDFTVSSRFAVVYKRDSINASAFIIQLGAGIKMPTGEFSKDAHETNNTFPGTGSWDIPFDANLYLIREKWMLQFENAFNLKTRNKIGYHYGNAFQSVVYANKTIGKRSLKVSPGVGIQTEYLFKDRIDGSSANTFNSGYLLTGVIGLNFQWKQVFLLVRYNQPLAQKLSKGYTTNKGQFSVSLFYTFKK